ncbi:MAG: FAD-dependent oxidoreductase [Bacteroidales bacterium]|nr:FAD-dependent oxidoreductase [Bacteroidales bacterium]
MIQRLISTGLLVFTLGCTAGQYDVAVIGGGTGGTAAAIEAARDGARVLVVEESPWLGGMLTSAGVSAVDGNYRLRGGIFGEFADSLAARYGGYEVLKSGWVSNILFNPAVGADIFANMAGEAGVEVRFRKSVRSIRRLPVTAGNDGAWRITLDDGSRIKARILIDGTELGDVALAAGAEELKDSRALQDMTYVATVKYYDHDATIPEPDDYDPERYSQCCARWPAEMMLSYGKLPDGHIMLNWPQSGNDIYLEYLDIPREEVYRQAKNRTLGYIYYLQTALGYRNLGIADDVYPSPDGLPFYPYYRESRRFAGRDTMTVEAANSPYDHDLYSRAVAVGDYPVDHHHNQHPLRKELSHLWWGKIPSFSVPLGALVPVKVEDLLLCDKNISTSWEMNGGTRLQPVVLGIGQAAGALAAIAVKTNRHPSEVPAAEVQAVLLDHGCYLLPFLDLKPGQPGFRELQESGVRGEVKGTGRSIGWANETWVNIPENE